MKSKKDNVTIDEIIKLGQELKQINYDILNIHVKTSSMIPKNHKACNDLRKVCKLLSSIKSDLEEEFWSDLDFNLENPIDCFYNLEDKPIIKENNVKQFIKDCLKINVGKDIHSSTLFNAYKIFCLNRSEKPLGRNKFILEMKNLNYIYSDNCIDFDGKRCRGFKDLSIRFDRKYELKECFNL